MRRLSQQGAPGFDHAQAQRPEAVNFLERKVKNPGIRCAENKVLLFAAGYGISLIDEHSLFYGCFSGELFCNEIQKAVLRRRA
jgi:hypothetical protein